MARQPDSQTAKQPGGENGGKKAGVTLSAPANCLAATWTPSTHECWAPSSLEGLSAALTYRHAIKCQPGRSRPPSVSVPGLVAPAQDANPNPNPTQIPSACLCQPVSLPGLRVCNLVDVRRTSGASQPPTSEAALPGNTTSHADCTCITGDHSALSPPRVPPWPPWHAVVPIRWCPIPTVLYISTKYFPALAGSWLVKFFSVPPLQVQAQAEAEARRLIIIH